MTEAPEIYKVLAEKHNLTVEQVREAIIYFWRMGVKRGLENMVNNEVYIPKLGSFVIKEYKLKYVIPQSYDMSIRSDIHERNAEYFAALNTRLKNIQKLIEERDEKYNEFLKHNPQYIPKQAPDMGRPTEQVN